METLTEVAIGTSAASSEAMSRKIEEGNLDLATIYQPRRASGFSALQLFQDKFVLVSSGPIGLLNELGGSYVRIDWGPKFQAEHLLNFHELDASRLKLGIGTLGLQCLKSIPSAGHLTKRVIEAELRSGQLGLIKEAPRVVFAAYAVVAQDDESELSGQVARMLRNA